LASHLKANCDDTEQDSVIRQIPAETHTENTLVRHKQNMSEQMLYETKTATLAQHVRATQSCEY